MAHEILKFTAGANTPPKSGDRLKALDAERKAIAGGMVDDMLAALKDAAEKTADIAAVDAVQPGVRDLASKLSERLYAEITTLVALRDRK